MQKLLGEMHNNMMRRLGIYGTPKEPMPSDQLAGLTKEYVRKAMMEEVCQGLEGHSPVDNYTPHYSVAIMGVAIKCNKCKRDIWIDWPEKPPAGLDDNYPYPKPTPYYP
jgi:hypothetical protein